MEERRLTALQLKLDYKTCSCGTVGAQAKYQAGSTTVQCPNCRLSYTAPDAEFQAALAGWKTITNQPKR
jgi:hypothetical protein